MPTELKKWISETNKIAASKSRGELDQHFFGRDPVRPIFIDDELIFSPADGILIYQEWVDDPTKAVVDVKGRSFNLHELMGDADYDKQSFVCSVFMTAFDIHYNRLPTAGLVSYHLLDALATKNYPMLEVEDGLLDGILDSSLVDYMKVNERMFNRVYCPQLDYTYYIIAIADEDVDCILPFSVKQDKFYHQNQRFEFVRFGSQVDLVLPIDPRFSFETPLKPLVHVEAGIDPLVRLHMRQNLVAPGPKQ